MDAGSTGTKWEPSEQQLAVLAVFQDAGYDITVGEACAKANVSRRTYYNWHDHPQFSEWWQFQVDRYFRLELHRVYRAAFGAADPRSASFDGDGKPLLGLTGDRKLLLERFDRSYCPQTRGEISGPGGNPIAIQIIQFGQPDEAETHDTDPGDSAAGA